MARPTDAAIARAFWAAYENYQDDQYDSLDDLVDAVLVDAGFFDKPAIHEKLTTSPERAQIPAESGRVVPPAAVIFAQLRREEGRIEEAHNAAVRAMKVACPIPTCRAELMPGQTCGGVNCGLKPK